MNKLHTEILTLCPPCNVSFSLGQIISRAKNDQKADILRAVPVMVSKGILRKGRKYYRATARDWGQIETCIDFSKSAPNYNRQLNNKIQGRRIDEIFKENRISPDFYGMEVINLLRDNVDFRFCVIGVVGVNDIINKYGLKEIQGWISFNWRKDS